MDYLTVIDIISHTLPKKLCIIKRFKLLRSLVVAAILWVVHTPLSAQDPTIYVSPHNLDQTLSNIYISLDNNGHTYLNTVYYEADSTSKGRFIGLVYVVDFEIRNSDELVSCEPTVAFDLPFKIMVWKEESDIYISYVNPFILKRRYFIQGCDQYLNQFNKDMIRIVNDAIRTD
ncbi:DUF302 domain-containing protein [Reichenbachiella ulvae]|uniref:DUF302 domain-containing protein n=1 Tax=Reichenbachiella ulvae TaxID=2980104 RepID=A0ABT3CR88_9BACT|nr:DUF302 domain-containing protein [Reichenbachiella ulvae]MCV9386172.1 DUF302 domain-containing protein [Reichenbachiella ulvae]